jgi:hypothetical protein
MRVKIANFTYNNSCHENIDFAATHFVKRLG